LYFSFDVSDFLRFICTRIFPLKHYSLVALQWKLIRKFYKTSRSNRICTVRDVCFSTSVVYFDITDGFKGVKIDGAARVTKLNRIFWIILLLPKEKKKPFEKSYFPIRTHTHTPILYIIRLRLRTLYYILSRRNTWWLQLPGQPVRWFMESRFDSICRIHMVVLHAWWRRW